LKSDFASRENRNRYTNTSSPRFVAKIQHFDERLGRRHANPRNARLAKVKEWKSTLRQGGTMADWQGPNQVKQ
jgi:hypothetical protein